MSILIKSILGRQPITAPLRESLVPGDMYKQLSTMLFVYKSQPTQELTESSVNKTVSLYKKVYNLVVENKLCMPEEEMEVERTIKQLSEEMVTTGAIDASTPRIKTKQSVGPDDEIEDADDASIFKR